MSRNTDMRIDLHSHSTASDGKLTPDELVQQAIEAGVDVLSITDHDSVAAYRQINRSQSAPLRIIPGIEFSSQWQKSDIHILGLNIDPENDILRSGIAIQQQHRHDRASRIADRLARLLGIANPVNAVSAIAGNNNIGRPHFARYLIETGVVKDSREAFRKYLGT
ncbi:MAG: PHP domain-containing protein, partial [Gammaproteobacteria bacterium]